MLPHKLMEITPYTHIFTLTPNMKSETISFYPCICNQLQKGFHFLIKSLPRSSTVHVSDFTHVRDCIRWCTSKIQTCPNTPKLRTCSAKFGE